ncbi:serine/threonine-protein phosphatase Pgam5, mitochondrial isoform X2 [Chironomus tepperi]|uniref:serine/threonine-protein phosphatase Pgam5, mitochondrial isoform X2 n=1 Tax=Chironomus tepperi TaxID=113505 RepID=UPI00391FB92F
MSWKYFKQAINVGCYSLGGFSLYYLISNENNKKFVQNSWISDLKPPSTKWDKNWDHRDPSALLKSSLPENPTPDQQNKHNEELEKVTAKAVRHIILIRHGQYNTHALTDKGRILTELGREQAKMSGLRLNELKIPITNFVMSTMTRAQETGNIILNQLDNKKFIIENCSLIEEGAPIPPEPKVGHWKPQNWFFVDGSRIEAGFRKHFHRAAPDQKEDSYTVLVCHANVIRYYVCRALQVPPEAWLRMSLHHASITWLSIYPENGRVILKLFGDCGHIPKKSLSTA